LQHIIVGYDWSADILLMLMIHYTHRSIYLPLYRIFVSFDFNRFMLY